MFLRYHSNVCITLTSSTLRERSPKDRSVPVGRTADGCCPIARTGTEGPSLPRRAPTPWAQPGEEPGAEGLGALGGVGLFGGLGFF